MLTKLNHLTQSQQEKLAKITEIITKAMSPEKIICFGSRISPLQDWSCFTEAGTYNIDTYTAFDLLIITSDTEKRPDHEILDILEQQCNPYVYMNNIVHKLTAVNNAIKDGSLFFTTVYRKGLLIYESNSLLPLVEPAVSTDAKALLANAEQDWHHWYSAADDFLKGAEFYFSFQSYKRAVFMLHQAMENTCKALIRSFTGYLPTTHNLRRLIAMTENFSPLPALIFPGITTEEDELFFFFF